MEGDVNAAENYREQAKQLRALVDRTREEKIKTLLQSIASDYEELAAVSHPTRPSSETSAATQIAVSLSAGAGELRARAMRYWLLAETLSTPSVVEAVRACARELEGQALTMEIGEARRKRRVVQYRRSESSK